jgi:hypothetical protein
MIEITGRQMIIYLRAINARAQLRPSSRLIEIWRWLLTRNPDRKDSTDGPNFK